MLLLQDYVCKSMNSSVGIPLLLSEKEYFPCVHACMGPSVLICMCIFGPRYGVCVCVCVCMCVCVCLCTSLKYLWAGRLQLGKASV